ncbi:unnamed protein product [Spodoptera littoralis]|uniref:Uncharacterized protein n=1 Tax=Spodoptera littoralis TaxID=7109 RepID=A0A9P0HXC5_SPOLI|nr:unnamed protein product [Spodoptera littoralis]CAH1636251.1 unnamed protein product [Spodoptera littoralis]
MNSCPYFYGRRLHFLGLFSNEYVIIDHLCSLNNRCALSEYLYEWQRTLGSGYYIVAGVDRQIVLHCILISNQILTVRRLLNTSLLSGHINAKSISYYIMLLIKFVRKILRYTRVYKRYEERSVDTINVSATNYVIMDHLASI